MRMFRREESYIEQTENGRKFADQYEERLKKQNAFMERKEDSSRIIIVAGYWFDVTEC